MGRRVGWTWPVAGEKGAVATLVLLFLPCLLAAAALVIDVGALLLARAQLAAAADMGALAGVQDLDYELLARGQIVILESEAVADAVSWVRANLAGRAFLVEEAISVRVSVRNMPRGGGATCPVTGRTLLQPTVCVLIQAVVRPPFLPASGWVTMSVHADASVVGRP